MLIGSLLAASGGAVHADGSLINKAPNVAGPVQVHLAYADQSGNPQDVDLASAPQSLLSELPGDLQQLHGSPLLTAPLSDAFGQIWASLRDQDCGVISAQIQSDIHTSDNGAYGVSACSFSPLATLTATQETEWSDISQYPPPDVTGHRLLLDYWVPDNTVVFKVTSPYTCADSNLVCAADPQFTLSFDIHLQIALTEDDPSTFPNSLGCPLSVSASQWLLFDGVDGGDVSGQIRDALAAAAKELGTSAASGAASGQPLVTTAGVAATAAKLAAKLAGIGIDAIGNNGLRDTVSADLNFLSVPWPVDAGANPAVQGFNAFVRGCAASESLGITKFDASATPDGSLRFTLMHAADTAPSINANLAQGEPNLSLPALAASESEVNAGGQLTITGSNFHVPQGTQVQLVWDSADHPIGWSQIKWGSSGGRLQTMTVTASRQYTIGPSSYQITGLTPGVTYQFQVRDCDALTCTPWSAEADITTAGAGSGQVALYLDSVSAANQIGASTLQGDGSFSATVTIPGSATPGQHTVIAVVGASQGSQNLPLPSLPLVPFGAGALPGGSQGTPAPSGSGNGVVIDPNLIGNLGGAGGSQATTGQQASTTTTVVAAGQKLQPVIAVIDPATNAVVQAIQQSTSSSAPYTLRGQGFVKGGKVTVSLDTAGGPVLATTTVADDGTFSAKFKTPADATRDHLLVATEIVNGQTIQATVDVFVVGTPR